MAKQIRPEELIDKTFLVVSAGDDHLHLREVGTAAPVDVYPRMRVFSADVGERKHGKPLLHFTGDIENK